jgi:hypothetical protein
MEQEAEKHLAKMMADLEVEEKPAPVSPKVCSRGCSNRDSHGQAKLGIQIECDACGEKNMSSDRFCGKCGIPVRLTKASSPRQTPPSKPGLASSVNRSSSTNPNAPTGPVVKRTDPTPQLEKGSMFADHESIVEKKVCCWCFGLIFDSYS